jgi:drug/metabolite transporter (DMT)-like permease
VSSRSARLRAAWLARPANLRGALWMMAAAFGFTVNGALVKSLGEAGMHAFQIALARAVVSGLVLLPLLWRAGPRVLATRHPWTHLLRGVAGSSAMICGFYALTKLPLAEVTALSFTTPLFTIVLAVLLLREPVRWRRWSATAVGFLGVLIMVRPGAQAFEPAALAALAMAFGIALAVTLVKRFPEGESHLAMLVYFCLASILMAVGPAVYFWRAPTPGEGLLLVAIGVLGVASQALIIRAFRAGEATFVAPFDYSKLVLAGAIGFALFGEVPDLWMLAGAAVIVAATLYIARRDAQLGRSRPAGA